MLLYIQILLNKSRKHIIKSSKSKNFIPQNLNLFPEKINWILNHYELKSFLIPAFRLNSFTNGPKLHKEMILESKNIFSIDVVSKWVLVVGTETLPFQKPNTVMSSFKGTFLFIINLIYVIWFSSILF